MQQRNLTQIEIQAIDSDVNVADGHARQSLTWSQARMVEQFPILFAQASKAGFAGLETAAHRSFFRALGQDSAPVGTGRILSAYSSSVAMDVLARCVADVGATVALIHPTFDNIPDLLRSRGVPLLPFEEVLIAAGEIPPGLGPGDCAFVTMPNNPTGIWLDERQLSRLAASCAAREVTLIMDTSFRGFDRRAQYDTYAVLEASSCSYVVIEDTGKLWPMSELKLGFMVRGQQCALGLEDALSDVLLTVSPFVLAVVERLAADAEAGGLDDLHALIEGNRAMLAGTLSGSQTVSLVDLGGRVSVALVELRGVDATPLAAALAGREVHVLPCSPFFWADPRMGERFVRVALARDQTELRKAGRALRREAERLAQFGAPAPV